MKWIEWGGAGGARVNLVISMIGNETASAADGLMAAAFVQRSSLTTHYLTSIYREAVINNSSYQNSR